MKRIVVMADEAKLFFESRLQYGITLAKMYCDVWREPPWNEDFWKEDEVLAELIAQNSKKTAIGCYAIIESEDYEKIVGFTLGYEVGKEEMQSISSCSKLDYLFKDNQKGFYIDELAVQSDFRNLGIASALCKDLIRKAGNSGVDLFILRTDEKAEPAREVYRSLGFRDTFIRDGKHPTRTYLVKFL